MQKQGMWLSVLALSLVPAAAPGQEGQPAALSDAEKEHFLIEASLVKRKGTPGGRTLSRRVTLSLDGFEHDAHVQTIDVKKPLEHLKSGPELDFRDSYRNNIAAYRLDRLLGLRMVPVTVFRHYDNKEAAFTWWVDDLAMDLEEQSRNKARPPSPVKWNCQVFTMRAFDQLIYNFDRNPGNLLIDEGWWIWMIDHTRAFKVFGDLQNEEELGPVVERRFLSGIKSLDESALNEVTEDLLNAGQIEGLLARRDKIVAHYEARITRLGDGILCDLPSPGAAGESP